MVFRAPERSILKVCEPRSAEKCHLQTAMADFRSDCETDWNSFQYAMMRIQEEIRGWFRR